MILHTPHLTIALVLKGIVFILILHVCVLIFPLAAMLRIIQWIIKIRWYLIAIFLLVFVIQPI
ncbi:hypothetical protein CGK40_24970 [Vibrio parahaemolyticus]|nr:hypothetical protein CGK40_24970 [Vibrio parahaemolyticus]